MSENGQSGLNGVEVARLGLILCVDGATGGREVLGYLPSLPDPKRVKQMQKYRIFEH